jgi:hypothetical protein
MRETDVGGICCRQSDHLRIDDGGRCSGS